MNPTQLSIRHLHDLGAMVGRVEYYDAHGGVYHDLFGFIDLVAIERDHPGVLGVQTTTKSNVWNRLAKLREERAPKMRRWLQAANRLVIHGWFKQSGRWVLSETVITLAMLDEPAPPRRRRVIAVAGPGSKGWPDEGVPF